MIDYDLLFSRVMWRLSLVSEAPAAAMGNESSHTKPGSKVLYDPGFAQPRLVFHYGQCQTEGARRRVIEEALDELRHAMYAADHTERRGTVEWKRALAHDPRGSRTVAKLRGVDHKTVLKYRKES